MCAFFEMSNQYISKSICLLLHVNNFYIKIPRLIK